MCGLGGMLLPLSYYYPTRGGCQAGGVLRDKARAAAACSRTACRGLNGVFRGTHCASPRYGSGTSAKRRRVDTGGRLR